LSSTSCPGQSDAVSRGGRHGHDIREPGGDTHSYPERRRRFEQPLLDHYHATLVEAGVQGYDRRALDDDYRLAVLMQLATPLLGCNIRVPPVVWWNHLEHTTAAVDDLGCRDLLA
jgi:hypothetical protein